MPKKVVYARADRGQAAASLSVARPRENRAAGLQRGHELAQQSRQFSHQLFTLPQGRGAGCVTLGNRCGYERVLLIRALEAAGGNQSRAARILRVGRDALRYKLKKHNLDLPDSGRTSVAG